MLFNSIEYFLFFPIVFSLYWFVFNKKLEGQNLLLLAASYFFYGWWSWEFMLLLALSTILDYAYGFGVASSDRKKAKLFLWLSIINNLGILCVFKYYNFFITQVQAGFDLLGMHTNPLILNIALPVGISFYTFHGMSYVFDIYRGKQEPVNSIVDYAVFVSFFPLLVAGPIERAGHLLPQVKTKRCFSYTQALEGSRLILWGMFKKVVIADNLAFTANEAFGHYSSHNGATLIAGAIAFSFQIYGDFSGYSDIAIGSAKLLGFELLTNFKFPYFSRDIAEFWRRWHISLSTWFRDYLYIPLGGSRNGKWNAVRNTFIIFIISGLWHGASWNFIVWGGIHACAFMPLLILNRNRFYVSEIVANNSMLPTFKEFVQMITTFLFVTFAWIFFRAESVNVALSYIQHLFKSMYENPVILPDPGIGLSNFIFIPFLIFMEWIFRKDERHLRIPIKNRYIRRCVYLLFALLVIAYLISAGNNSFIYFQF